ncbi:hypothetical protein D9M71_722110 [compost metagenome]
MAWPKPMILSLRASMASVPAVASSGEENFSIISMAASLAPPCSGPRRVPMEPVMQEYMSDRVEAHTRPAKVEALNSCSA